MDGNCNSFGEPIDHDGESLEYGFMDGNVPPFAVSADVFRELFTSPEKIEGAHLESGPLDGDVVRNSSSGGIPVMERVDIEDITNVLSEDEAPSPRAVKVSSLDHTSSTIHAVLRTSKYEREELFRARNKLGSVLDFLRKKGFTEEQVLEEMKLGGSGGKLMERDDFGLPLLQKKPANATSPPGCDPLVDKMKSKLVMEDPREVFEEMPKRDSVLNSKKSGPNSSEEVKSWANVVKKELPPVNFKFFPLEKGASLVDPPVDVLKKGNEKFKLCVVGTFSKGTQPYKSVSEFAFQNWRSKGLTSVHQKDTSTYIFRFANEAGINAVLARGTWYVGRRPMILTAWGQKPGCTKISSLPLWVKFSRLPDCYWTEEGLARIASVIGEPLGADEPTSRLDVLPFAKMQVRYKIGDPLPNEIAVSVIDPITEERSVAKVLVSYPLRPLSCSGCHSLGHSVAACPLVTRVWQKKATPLVQEAATVNNNSIASQPNVPIANCVVQTKLDEEQSKANDWIEIKRKSQGGTSGTISDSESPPICNTFKNLKKVDEVDVKKGMAPPTTASHIQMPIQTQPVKLSRSQRKRLKASMGTDPSSQS